MTAGLPGVAAGARAVSAWACQAPPPVSQQMEMTGDTPHML